MGFLDFLKKKDGIPVPPPPSAPKDVMSPDAPSPPVDMLPEDPGQIDWNTVHDVPLPPPSMQSQDFLKPEPKATLSIPEPAWWTQEHDKEPKQDLTIPELPAPQKLATEMPSIEKTEMQQEPEKPIDLPDFTEEDIAAATPQEPPSLPPLPSLPEKQFDLPKSEDLAQPEPILEQAMPTKFVSSQSYFMILGEFKATRRSLRQSDEVIKEAVLRNEQLDQQYKRIAIDINAIQENLIKIDEAL